MNVLWKFDKIKNFWLFSLVRRMSVEQRINLKFLVPLGKTPTEALKLLQEVYGDDTMSRTRFFEWYRRQAGVSPASRDREGKIKIRGAQDFRRKAKVFSDRNHKFSDQKQVISKKKKRSSPKSEGFFWPKSQILTFFPPQNTNFFQKNTVGGKKKIEGAKTKIGGRSPLPPLATHLEAGHGMEWNGRRFFHIPYWQFSSIPYQKSSIPY